MIMNHLLGNGDGHLKNYGILYKDDFTNSYLAPIYDVITTTIYIKNDIPALRLGDGKLWWKKKSYNTFAKLSCKLSNKEYEDILLECKEAIIQTKLEIDKYDTKDKETQKFLHTLKECWRENV
jgi:serine/threonine-protein kinase HipA